MKTKPWAIILIVICTIFTSSAQIMYKLGSNKLSFDFISIITNWQIMTGIILYGIGAILVIIALQGGEVTTLYPIITSSYIWVTIGAAYLFKELITPLRGGGIALIIIGILFITFGEKNKEVIKLT